MEQLGSTMVEKSEHAQAWISGCKQELFILSFKTNPYTLMEK